MQRSLFSSVGRSFINLCFTIVGRSDSRVPFSCDHHQPICFKSPFLRVLTNLFQRSLYGRWPIEIRRSLLYDRWPIAFKDPFNPIVDRSVLTIRFITVVSRSCLTIPFLRSLADRNPTTPFLMIAGRSESNYPLAIVGEPAMTILF